MSSGRLEYVAVHAPRVLLMCRHVPPTCRPPATHTPKAAANVLYQLEPNVNRLWLTLGSFGAEFDQSDRC